MAPGRRLRGDDPSTLSAGDVIALLRPYVVDCNEGLARKLSLYLELLLKWNARTNLTAIREPAEMVRRHFGESLFAAGRIGDAATLLDYGSGAGFPGLPIALGRGDVRVTLAESQGKKAAFLREVVRVLEVPVEVWAGRVEDMPLGRRFDAVVMRSVDGMDRALARAWGLASRSVVVLTTGAAEGGLVIDPGFALVERCALPEAEGRLLLRFGRVEGPTVPRGTFPPGVPPRAAGGG